MHEHVGHPGQATIVAFGVTHGKDRDARVAGRPPGAAVADEGAFGNVLDLGDARLPCQRRPQIDGDAAALRAGDARLLRRPQAVDRDSQPREVEMRSGEQQRGGGTRGMPHCRRATGGAKRSGNAIEGLDLALGKLVIRRVLDVGEMRAEPFQFEPFGGADPLRVSGYVPFEDPLPVRAGLDLDVERHPDPGVPAELVEPFDGLEVVDDGA